MIHTDDYLVEAQALSTQELFVKHVMQAPCGGKVPDQNQKRDAGKSDPMMVEEDLALALECVNRTLDYGKEKYGQRGGWKKVDISRYKSANGRHRRDRMKAQKDLEPDSETDLPHLAHEIVNAMFILQTALEKLTPAQLKKVMTYKEPPHA